MMRKFFVFSSDKFYM